MQPTMRSGIPESGQYCTVMKISHLLLWWIKSRPVDFLMPIAACATGAACGGPTWRGCNGPADHRHPAGRAGAAYAFSEIQVLLPH
jgi:hypothetical protein